MYIHTVIHNAQCKTYAFKILIQHGEAVTVMSDG